LRVTEKNPYFIQEWGYQAWKLSVESTINLVAVKKASEGSIKRLDQNFFRARFDRLTPKEREYLRAMAELGSGAHRSGDIADMLDQEVQRAAPIRNNLIKKGMIYSPAHGDTEFAVPLFVGFMKRIMPTFSR